MLLRVPPRPGISGMAAAQGSCRPVSIEIRLLQADEGPVLDHVVPDVFDHVIDPRWSAEFLADPRHHLVVALEGALVVGFASAVHYVHPDKRPELWINEVGVAPSYQSQGLGRRLLQALLHQGRCWDACRLGS